MATSTRSITDRLVEPEQDGKGGSRDLNTPQCPPTDGGVAEIRRLLITGMKSQYVFVAIFEYFKQYICKERLSYADPQKRKFLMKLKVHWRLTRVIDFMKRKK